MSRLSGVTIPLFSLRSWTDWGIGQLTDLPAAAEFFARAGQKLIQLLPAHELAVGETSPYGALSAFALDPIFIDMGAVPDVDKSMLDDAMRAELNRVREAKAVDYLAVRALKTKVLSRAFDRFRKEELAKNSPRAKALLAFVDRETAWLRDFALYAALRDSHDGYGWSTWPEAERDRHPEILAIAKSPKDDGKLGTRVLEQMYRQWLVHEQWAWARAELKKKGIALMGDMPFIVGSESADVWAHRDQFRTDLSLGAPPDDFAKDGQSWGLPVYDFRKMDEDDLAWIRARAAHAAALFDQFRIDHVVGFFRQWVKANTPDAKGYFDPGPEPEQEARGEKVLRAMIDAAGKGSVIAEDLGVIPDFVRAALRRLELPGYKVLPWERNQDFVPHDPRQFPELSVATWSTHDTAPITRWWHELESWERERLAQLDGIPLDLPEGEMELRLLKLLFSSKSDLALVQAQEILGDKTRINLPGTVTAQNWTWRLARPLDDLAKDPAVLDRLEAIRKLAVESGR